MFDVICFDDEYILIFVVAPVAITIDLAHD